MKIPYYTFMMNFNDETGSLFLEGSGISIEFKINEEERNQILSFLEEIKKIDDIILKDNNILFAPTKTLLDNGIIDSIEVEYLNQFWKTINYIFLGPYRVLKQHAGDTEKQRKALRDFFKPIRFRLRSTQKIMEVENKIDLENIIEEII